MEQINIDEIVSRVSVVDGDALLTPDVLSRIVNAVLHAVDERDAHRRRVRNESRVLSGVREQQIGEGG